LRRSWERCDSGTLDTYLVSDVEDPRINAQSILKRALICDSLWPGRFDHLINEEFRFGLALTWILCHLRKGIPRGRLLNAIRDGRSDLCPRFILDASESPDGDDSSLQDYLWAALESDDEATATSLPEPVLDTFLPLWRNRLTDLQHPGISVVEPACGSANDFRYLHAFGFNRFLRYTGFDIVPKNIGNAKKRFPDTEFRVGDILACDLEDDFSEFCFVHDLFEHLSPSGLTKALEEVLRITRCQAWLHFFNISDIPEHRFHCRESYHWNQLSLSELVRTVGAMAHGVDVVRTSDLARVKFGFVGYYNQGACTLIVTK
jgi:hypothetical protein